LHKTANHPVGPIFTASQAASKIPVSYILLYKIAPQLYGIHNFFPQKVAQQYEFARLVLGKSTQAFWVQFCKKNNTLQLPARVFLLECFIFFCKHDNKKLSDKKKLFIRLFLLFFLLCDHFPS
jgi:hypothetical protein